MSPSCAESVADLSTGIARLLICAEWLSLASDVAFTAVILPLVIVMLTVTLPYRSLEVFPVYVPSFSPEDELELVDVDDDVVDVDVVLDDAFLAAVVLAAVAVLVLVDSALVDVVAGSV